MREGESMFDLSHRTNKQTHTHPRACEHKMELLQEIFLEQ